MYRSAPSLASRADGSSRAQKRRPPRRVSEAAARLLAASRPATARDHSESDCRLKEWRSEGGTTTIGER
eukprot:6654236-Prymnesium_polylepis.1